jgi:hypothetical protein
MINSFYQIYSTRSVVINIFFILDVLCTMTSNQSLFQRHNRTITLNYTRPPKQFLFNDVSLTPDFSFTRSIYVFLIFSIFSIVLIAIIILLCVYKCTRQENKKLHRKKPVVKRPFEPKSDDVHATLLPQNGNGTISHDPIISNDTLLADSVSEHQVTDTLPDTPTDSIPLIGSKHVSTTNLMNETNDNNDLSDLDFSSIQLRSTKVPNPQSRENTDQPPDGPYENPYIAEFKRQETVEAEAREQRNSTKISSDSTSSEESCL